MLRTRVLAIGVLFLVHTSFSTARMREADLERYFSKNKDRSFLLMTSTPEERNRQIEDALKNRGSGAFLPGDELVAKKAIADYAHIEQLLYDRIFKKTKIGEDDLTLLKNVYSTKDYSVYLRWPAALLLYIETDDVTYIKEIMTTVSRPAVNKMICPTYIKIYSEVHDDKYHLIVTDLILNATREILFAEVSGSRYSAAKDSLPLTRDYLPVILANYPELCISIYEQGLPSEYVDFLYRNYLTMRRYATSFGSSLEIAQKLYAYSPQACKGFSSALLEADSREDIRNISGGGEKLVNLLLEVCAEKVASQTQEAEKYVELRKMIQETSK